MSLQLEFTGNNKKLKTSKTAEGAKKKNFRCFTTVYAMLVENSEGIYSNESAVAKLNWYDYNAVKTAIRESKFRFPYTRSNKEQFEKVFKNIERLMKFGELYVSPEQYRKEYLPKRVRKLAEDDNFINERIKRMSDYEDR